VLHQLQFLLCVVVLLPQVLPATPAEHQPLPKELQSNCKPSSVTECRCFAKDLSYRLVRSEVNVVPRLSITFPQSLAIEPQSKRYLGNVSRPLCQHNSILFLDGRKQIQIQLGKGLFRQLAVLCCQQASLIGQDLLDLEVSARYKFNRCPPQQS
jgi:hypothetical protein